jgi:outer membrane receptor protein involved in Fe transport
VVHTCPVSSHQKTIVSAIALGFGTISYSGGLLAANPTEELEVPTVQVVGTTPLPGLATPLRDVPANVQLFGGRDLRQQQQTNLGDYLAEAPTGVTINSAQGNPSQSDINFRGFTASPVLGTPQGLSVFMDGVRINESFGDGVNWDLIPGSAISGIQLIPGSNPTFGLNTLGGALAVYTKSGSQYPGGNVELQGGSFGRRNATVEVGGKRDDFDYFFTANALNDDGWAEHNPSRIRQAFGKLGWQNDTSDLDVSLTLTDNTLEGVQALPLSFMDDIRKAYTFPDRNTNKLAFLTVKGSRYLSDDLILGGNAYYRQYKNTNYSSNSNDAYVDGTVDSTVAEFYPALNDLSVIDQDSYGFGLQLTSSGRIAAKENRVAVGFSADLGRATFTQNSQYATFTADRGTLAATDPILGTFVRATDAETRNRYFGLFVTDTLKSTEAWTLTLSGRYNRAWVKVADQSGTAPELNGEHTYTRFNPAVGLNYSPQADFTAYASYNEGMRAPSPIELACADPNAPCKLPNNFLADPDLKKVVSRTAEFGARGKLAGGGEWSAAAYRTELQDDIQFISAGAGANNAGYFQNVGNTLRQGIELAVSKKFGGLTASARYGYVNATFESAFTVNSPNNSSADVAGDIQVTPGNHIPGIPQHNLKLRLQYDWGDQLTLGTSVISSSAVYARGDENNQDVNGKVPGYSVVNVDARYQLSKGFEIFGRVSNLFDRHYANFGILGENFFTGPGRTFDAVNTTREQFRGPGAPRGAWVGLRYQWL